MRKLKVSESFKVVNTSVSGLVMAIKGHNIKVKFTDDESQWYETVSKVNFYRENGLKLLA